MLDRRQFALLTLGTSLLPSAWACVAAGKYNEVLSVGDAAPAWNNLPDFNGKKHSLADLAGSRHVLVVFTCNSCPCAVDYEDRLLNFCKKYAGPGQGMAVVAINVNTIPADQPPAMKKKAEAKKFPFPYLYDETQKIAKDYGVSYTPEFFLLDDRRRVAYLGAMDDKDPPAKPSKFYLEDAVLALRAGKAAPVGETAGRGCLIRWNDRRKRKV